MEINGGSPEGSVEIAFTEGDGRINVVPMVLTAIVRAGFLDCE